MGVVFRTISLGELQRTRKGFFYMNEEKREVEVDTVSTAIPNQNEQTSDETISILKSEYEKAIQSETDKVRTKYSKQVKELEAKIKELEAKEEKVPEKSEKEIELEAREKALLARENAIAINQALTSKGMKTELAEYLKEGVNVDQLSNVIDSMVSERMTAQGYVPLNHKTGKGMTKEDFYNMDMDAQEKFFRENPESFHALFN